MLVINQRGHNGYNPLPNARAKEPLFHVSRMVPWNGLGQKQAVGGLTKDPSDNDISGPPSDPVCDMVWRCSQDMSMSENHATMMGIASTQNIPYIKILTHKLEN